LKHCFLDFSKLAFCVCQKAHNSVAGFFETKKHRFMDLNQVANCEGLKAGNEILGRFQHLKYRFNAFKKIRILPHPE
jgi:hypothetical protein